MILKVPSGKRSTGAMDAQTKPVCEQDRGLLNPADYLGVLEDVAERHGHETPQFRQAALGALKHAVSAARKAADRQLRQDGKGTNCARALSASQDALIRALYGFASTRIYPAGNPSAAQRVAVVAVGGYGRGTLAPGSDIDLLFLLPYKQTAWGESVVEFLLYMLWDLGFKVGHATRSIDGCIRLASADSTVLTSILEARFVCGDQALFDEMSARYRHEAVEGAAENFIVEKLAERDLRHQRAGESRYLVEPDVKDGKGGMRDLHTLFWIAKFIYATESPSELVKAGVFTRTELNLFLRCEDFLWSVRCHMHFLDARADDRLSFDKQADLAERMGYAGRGGLTAVERFMRHYFLVAKEVGDLTRIFCAVLEAQQMKAAPRLSRLFASFRNLAARKIAAAGDFQFDAGRLSIKSENTFSSDPVNLIRLFAHADKYNVGIHPSALKQVRRSLKLINKQLRHDPEANRLFVSMLCDSRDPEAILRRLNEAGVLGRFIPDFGRIVAMMQFNMYHHFTVDEHLIRTVGALKEIEHGALAGEHPLASDIVHTLKSRRVLYVAALLHDIAKGRREHHSIAGERIAKQLCPRLGLTPAETETVAWLVLQHLLMSETAQMRDLNDFKTISDFAAVVQSPERLKLLLILTVIDIRAVGPGVWNGWKGQLLRTLYFEAEPLVSGGYSTISRTDRVNGAKAAFAERMTGWDQAKREAYIARHHEPYWLNADLDHHVAHARLIDAAQDAGDQVAVDVRIDEFTAISEITVYAPDHPRLLAQLTEACAAAGGNIAGAQIFTTADGMALDTLLIQRGFTDSADEERRAARITSLIRSALSGGCRLPEAVATAARPRGRFSAFSVEAQVVVDNDSSNQYTVIEVAGLDRVGLLFELTDALFRLNLNIASAHVTTFGERAVDVFYVTDLTDAKITNASRRSAIVRSLTGVLTSSGARTPDRPAA